MYPFGVLRAVSRRGYQGAGTHTERDWADLWCVTMWNLLRNHTCMIVARATIRAVYYVHCTRCHGTIRMEGVEVCLNTPPLTLKG